MQKNFLFSLFIFLISSSAFASEFDFYFLGGLASYPSNDVGLFSGTKSSITEDSKTKGGVNKIEASAGFAYFLNPSFGFRPYYRFTSPAKSTGTMSFSGGGTGSNSMSYSTWSAGSDLII